MGAPSAQQVRDAIEHGAKAKLALELEKELIPLIIQEALESSGASNEDQAVVQASRIAQAVRGRLRAIAVKYSVVAVEAVRAAHHSSSAEPEPDTIGEC